VFGCVGVQFGVQPEGSGVVITEASDISEVAQYLAVLERLIGDVLLTLVSSGTLSQGQAARVLEDAMVFAQDQYGTTSIAAIASQGFMERVLQALPR
jgi:hypothetical protein